MVHENLNRTRVTDHTLPGSAKNAWTSTRDPNTDEQKSASFVEENVQLYDRPDSVQAAPRA
jgi:hypothetical protein